MTVGPSGSPGRLLVVAGPIGNLGDLSGRLRDALASASLVVAEDTRRTRKLLAHLGLELPMASLPAAREADRTPDLVRRISSGETIALITDAGTPAVSDPGGMLTRAVLDAGHRVEPIPGPSAVTTALSCTGATGSAAGLLFLGFLPRKGSARRAILDEMAASRRVVVLFESPRRIRATLEEIDDRLDGRRIVLCRELTKLHEELRVGTASEILKALPPEPRGEITLVVDGAMTAGTPDPISDEELRAYLAARIASGDRASQAARHAARDLGVPKRRAYGLAIALDPS